MIDIHLLNENKLHGCQQNLFKTSRRPLVDHLGCCKPSTVSVWNISFTKSSRAWMQFDWGGFYIIAL